MADDVLPLKPSPFSQALGKTEGHGDRSSNPVACCHSGQNASNPISVTDAHVSSNRPARALLPLF